MRRRESKSSLLPFYGGLNTVPDFSRVARNFALIRKAIAELRKIEDAFLSGSVTDEQYKQGLQEMVDFSGTIVVEADKATAMVASIRNRVAGYERELVDALG